MKKFSPFTSVFRQGVLVLLVCIGAATATMGLLARDTADQIGTRALKLRAIEVTALVADLGGGAIRFGKRELLAETLRGAIEKAEGEQDAALAVNARGEVLAEVGSDRTRVAALRRLAQQALKTGRPQASADGLIVAQPVHYGKPDAIVGAVATHWNETKTSKLLQESFKRDIALTAVVFVIALLAGVMAVGRGLARPLHRLSGAVAKVAQGDYAARIPGRRRQDEVGDIGKALDSLRSQLAEAEAGTLEARYKGAAFEGSSAPMMLIDDGLIVRHANPAMVALLDLCAPDIRKRAPDFSSEALVGASIEGFHPDGGPMRTLLAKSKQGPAQVVMRLGERRLKLTTAAVRNEADEILGSIVEWQDVTAETMNAAVLEALNKDQSRAEFDTDGRMILCNDRFAEALGASQDSLVTRALDDLIHPAWRAKHEISRVLDSLSRGQPLPGKIRMQRLDSGCACFDGALICVRDPAGVPIRYLFLGRDITKDEARITAAEEARLKLVEAQGKVVDALRVGLRRMREGNLQQQIVEDFPEEYNELRGDYNATLETLAGALGEIAANASNIFSEARDISSTADSLSRRTESTAATLEETAAALDQLTTSVKSAAERAAEADEEVGDARRRAEKGGDVVVETVAAMDRISTSSDRIASITNVIEDIAFQTNLLALNAGVEAARAGEAGRGFAVVASEVRALAQRCSEAAREINELIAESGTHVKHGVDLVGQTGDALRDIVKSITGIASLVSEIAGSARQQSSGLAEINTAVNDLDQSTQQNAARLEETTAASQSLTNDAMSMVEAVSHFQIGDGSAAQLSEARTSGSEPTERVVSFSSRRETPRAPARQDPPSESAASEPRRAVAGGSAGGAELVEADPDGWSEY
ncbi:hypothetical protein U879_09180 [Defluviimonas sp. 20V17]|uniref:Chemotaxis protein n=1 Tax=Allgaiera indica TaxID=765699 RepID=A0AAN4ZZ31_9RHOB|nr:methyl-accepting chemotaxis protein [Allgaiera indica]KDB04011.1 hypothetical protein U879_09180 [Defluviimonas sp. 20V17]GHD99334.1 chemotaxis protein [Allgaiera indica]SDW28609.1 methyl-accepting chemotaxis protein [Allgaiera indica]